MKRWLLTACTALLLSACGSALATGSGPTPIPVITPPSLAPNDTPSASPTATPSISSTSAPTLAPAPTAPPAPPAPMSRSFALLPLGGSGASGVVTVVQANGLDNATVSIRGLAMGAVTQHAVHVHLGSCASPYAGMHLTVLGLLTGIDGSGRLVAPIAPVYLSAGHYVIVYATSVPQRIIGCADLGPL